MIIKADNLTVHDISTNETFSKSFIFNSPNRRMNDLGRVALLVDVDMNTEFAEKISEIVSDVLKQEYFRFRATEKKLIQLNHFESALNKLNQALSTLAAEGYVEWIDKLHVGIAAMTLNKVHIAFTGKVKIFLHRQNELINITANSQPSSQSNPMKTFINVVSGDLQLNDKIMMVSPNFLKYFSVEKIKRTLSQYSAKDAINNFKNLLQNFDNSALSSIVLELKDEKEAYEENFDFLKKSRRQTIDDLINQQQEQDIPTSEEEKQKPPVLPAEGSDYQVNNYNAAQKQKTPALNINQNQQNPYLRQLPKRKTNGNGFAKYIELAKDNILRFKEKALPVAEQVFGSIKSLGNKPKMPARRTMSRKAISTRSYLSPRINTSENKLPKFGLEKIKFFFSWVVNLPLKSKIILGGVCGIGAILAFSVFFHSSEPKEITKNSKTEISTDNTIVRASELNKKAADALIYNDNEKAKGYLVEAAGILEILKQDKKNQQEAEDLLKSVTGQLDKINNVKRLDGLTVISMPADLQAKGILGLANKLYTFDENKSEVYLIDEAKKEVSQISNESNSIGNLKFGAINLFKDYIEFLTDANLVSEFVLDDDNIYKIDISFDPKEKIIDFKNYFDALYVLDAENNQIWKHQRTIDGYNKGEAWIETVGVDIKDANSFAIDGDVYVLKNNGEIVSFLSGEKQDFTVKGLDKSFAANSKIFTLLDYANLYILDSANERIVVLDKAGNVLNQLVCSDFKNAKDLFVNEDGNKGYVLSDNKVIVFEMK